MSDSEFDLMVIGFDEKLNNLTAGVLKDYKVKRITSAQDFEPLLEGATLAPKTLVLVSSHTKDMGHLEVAQALSSTFPDALLFFVTSERFEFDVQNLKKNGFTEIFFLPMDQKVFMETVEAAASESRGGIKRRFKAVKLMDIQPGEDLPFEVRTYLPLNKRYALLTASGKLSDKKHQKLKEKSVNSVFIDVEKAEVFYKFAARKLLDMGHAGADAQSKTEREEKLRTTVRHLFRAVLDTTSSSFDEGKDLMDQSKAIVASYVEQKTGMDIRSKIQELIGEGSDSYSHAQIVSTMAALLSLGTGIGQPEDLAIAGLFHDIGLQGVRPDADIFNYKSLPDDELKAYMAHPKTSLNLLKERKITLTPKMCDIVERHHERIDGKGFPGQMLAHRIPLEAHLLAYADAYEYLTRVKDGQVRPSFAEIHKKISENLGLSPDVLGPVARFLNPNP